MGAFLETEKRRQVSWKARTTTLSEAARADGIYPGHTQLFPYCLPAAHAVENLFPDIRTEALDYFSRAGIKWHGSEVGQPSTHLVDSQICCLNFLMPLGRSPEVLLALFQRYFPQIRKVLPMDQDALVAFEWIGAENYLREKVQPGTQRVRGSYCTSVDAAVLFETESGGRIMVLIEWKYSESYTDKSYKYSANGTDRATIYQHLWEDERCPIDKTKVTDFDSLFHEPFYQFMRQQFLANEMEQARELGADAVYLMHLSPKANTDFRTITSAALRPFGSSATEAWKNVLVDGSRFLPLYTEDFFDAGIIRRDPALNVYWAYVVERYGGIVGL